MRPVRRWFRRRVLGHAGVCFVVLCASFLAFGAGTLNLIYLFQANARFIAEHGWAAVMDGALWQLGSLVLSGTLSMAAYVVFKACEHAMVAWLADSEP